MPVLRCLLLSMLVLLLSRPDATAQPAAYDTTLYSGLTYRMIGPFRGGRSTAVTGHPERAATFVMGTTGGGVWRTDDYGHHWKNITDGYFGGSVGAVAIAPSDPAVIYVGTGSADIRGNTSTGRGMWKSDDGGKTWRFAGLPEAGQIGRVVVHPRDADRLYVAALGHAFGKNPERGIFRSADGGATWQHVLALSDSTGGMSLSMNPHNPRELYAGMWRGERKPWTLLSGATDGGVYRTTDGGDTWTKLGGGLPTGIVGKVGVDVSPANPDRVWAIIEAEPEGGLYRSDDGGATWTRINSENKLRQRAWYYTHVRADPKDEHTVYVLNTGLYRSVDGGKTFTGISVPHGDVHDLWIDPEDTDVLAVADDGGAQVSVTSGKTWSSYYNQPTAELYGVAVDNQFPYRVYGAQQDNTAISVPAWTANYALYPKAGWENPGGCETGPVALHPDHPEITWGGCYGGALNRMDHLRGQVRNVMLYPQLQLGEAGQNLRHRFQWVAPILVSSHDPHVVYHASQYVNRTTDGGMTWTTISPDLTTNNAAHQGYSGGPINHDITGVEMFNTVFALAESPRDRDVLWAGTDDGRLHLTRDGGAQWTDITPRGMPALGTVNSIDVSVHRPGAAWVAVQRYRMDDFKPYIFHTTDYGASWALRTDGLPGDHPVRVVREDPERAGLVYAGTEFGLFVSFDAGRRWQPLQRNLPITPVTDLRIAHDDLILSTQGRSFWVLDDVTPLRQLDDAVAQAEAHLYAPRPAYRVNDRGTSEEYDPTPRPHGAILHYYLSDSTEALSLDVLDAAGGLVRHFSSDSAAAKEAKTPRLPDGPGLHRVVWDLTYPGPNFIEGTVIWGYTGGVKAPPGAYQVRLTAGGDVQTQPLELRPDPRLDNVTAADYAAQYDLAVEVRDALDAVIDAIRDVRSVRDQVAGAVARAAAAKADTTALGAQARTLQASLVALEEALLQTRNKSNQDPIRFAPRLDNQFSELYGYVTGPDGYIAGGPEGRPTAAAHERLADLKAAWAPLQQSISEVLTRDVAAFNAAYDALGLNAVTVTDP